MQRSQDHYIRAPGQAGSAPATLLVGARQEHRAVVTDNVKDFAPLSAAAVSGEGHAGVIFTLDRSFPRHRPSFVGAVVRALGDLLAREHDMGGRSHWLLGEP